MPSSGDREKILRAMLRLVTSFPEEHRRLVQREWLIASAIALVTLAGGIPALVVKPDSLLRELRDRGLPGRESAAGIPTAVVAPSAPYRGSLHVTSVDLTPGEWLLGTRESAAFFDLRLNEQPGSDTELERSVIDALGRPYVSFPRTWIGVMARGDGAGHISMRTQDPSRGE